jgi:replicative DNA helicase
LYKIYKQMMLQEALTYLGRASIIPLGRDKRPLINWKEYQTRQATEQEVRGWFDKWPDANIGIVTGKISNVVVVDVEKGGSIEGLPETVVAKTGGGGWHYYYQYQAGVENKARIRPLTDIRGEGGYVVAPPSIHSSGIKYEWLKQGQIQPFPKFLFGITEKTDWTKVAKGTYEGQRNETAAKYIGGLMNLFTPDTWENTVWQTALAWDEKNNPPMRERELRTIYESIKRRAITNERSDKLSTNDKKSLVEYLTFTEVLQKGIDELLGTKPSDVISCGYEWLDERVTGIFPGEMVVVGGETGTGKTTFVTNIVYKASKNCRCTVFALEDRLEYYAQKAIYFEVGRIRKDEGKGNYPWNDYRKNTITDPKYRDYINQAFDNLKNDKIIFVQAKVQMDIDLVEQIIRDQIEEGTELFLIDHLHYFNLLKDTKSSKADYIEQVMVRLKALQNETGARIILVVHYKKLEGKKPALDSFKDSISIVQNASYVINLYRERVIGTTDRFKTTFYIPKARNPNGEGTIEVIFDPSINDYKPQGHWVDGMSYYQSQDDEPKIL